LLAWRPWADLQAVPVSGFDVVAICPQIRCDAGTCGVSSCCGSQIKTYPRPLPSPTKPLWDAIVSAVGGPRGVESAGTVCCGPDPFRDAL
jgi:hypothetical protein